LLLVEDGAAEAQIVRRALRALGRDVALCVVRDGQEAVDYLLGQDGPAGARDRPFPDLVLLDLRMPRLDGLEVLAQVRKHPETRLLPVVVWTTSCEIDDVRAAYAAGANSYIEKPQDYERLRAILETVFRYWLDTALLP
jgi:CheY-like chemotaxis protein